MHGAREWSETGVVAAKASMFFKAAFMFKMLCAAVSAFQCRVLALSSAPTVEPDSLPGSFLQPLAGGAGETLWIAGFVYFMVWLYRASLNARTLLPGRRFSQKTVWSFVNFLIPLWRLFVPFRFISELCDASAEAASRRNGLRLWVWIAWAAFAGAAAVSAVLAAIYAKEAFQILAAGGAPDGIADAMPRGVLQMQTAGLGASAALQAVFALAAGRIASGTTLLQETARAARAAAPFAGAEPAEEPGAEDAAGVSPAPGEGGFGWPG